jgi:hypothetical protein
MANLFMIHPTRCPAFRQALALAVLCLCVGAASPASAWRQQIAGLRSGGSDIAHAEALDASGNAIVVGALDNGDDGIAFFVTKLAAGSGAELWRQEIAGSSAAALGAFAVTVDAAGDVIAAGELGVDFSVIKFSGATGNEIWRRQIDGTATFETTEEAHAVAVDAAGDVFAAGFVSNTGTGRDLFVIKCNGATGNELWRKEIDGGDGGADRANAIAVDTSGDVIAAGRLATSANEDDFTVLKLAGASGNELWRLRIDGTDHGDDEALAVALDAANDVVASGVIDSATGNEDFAVVKLAGGTGNELWRKEVDGALGGKITAESANSVVVDSAGDVVAAGNLEFVNQEQDFTVIKFAGLTGAEIWRYHIEGDMSAASDIAFTVAVDPSDDVIAGGRIENGPRLSFDFSVLKLSGATGTEIWRQMIGGTATIGPRLEEVRGLEVDAAGDVVAAGFLYNKDGGRDIAVLKFDGGTGGVGGVRATKIRVLDYAGSPERRLLTTELRDEALWSPPPGDLNDPTLVGAEVRLVNPVTLEEAAFVLPAGPNWKAFGSPPGASGYSYSDNGTNGPCTLFQVRPHERIRLSCSGKRGPIPFSLDEATQDSLAVTIRFGTSPVQCAVFGGKIRKDYGTGSPGPHAVFQAVYAPAPLGAACP